MACLSLPIFSVSVSLSITPPTPAIFPSFGTSESSLKLCLQARSVDIASVCPLSTLLPAPTSHLISADFLFPEASGSFHPSLLRRTDLTLPYALAFILKPYLPLSWRPPSAPWEHICSDFDRPLASWSHLRNPCAGRGGGGTSDASRVLRTAAAWGWSGGMLPNAFSQVTSSAAGTGDIWKAKTPSPEERRAQPPPHFRCWEMPPTHSTPPLDSCPHSG